MQIAMNLISQSTILFLSAILIELTNSLVFEDTIVTTANGGQLRLEGFAAHEGFATALGQHLQDSIRSAAQAAINKSKVKPGILLSKINYQQYTFIQIVHAMFLGDVDFSNILIQILSQQNLEENFIQNDRFLKSIDFPSDYIYTVIIFLAEHNINGLREVPNFISDNVLMLTNKNDVLLRASLEGNNQVIKWLFNMNATATFEAISVAWKGSHWGVVKLLLCRVVLSEGKPSREMSLMTNEENETLLHFAAESNRPDILEALIEAGGNVDATNSKGHTPLHRALDSNCLPCIEQLLEKQTKVPLGSILTLSIIRNNSLAFQELLKAKGSVEWETNYGISPLYLSKRLLIVSLLKYLIALHIDRVRDLKNLGIRESLLFEAILYQDCENNFSDTEIRQKNNLEYLSEIYHTLEAGSNVQGSADDLDRDSLIKAIAKFGNSGLEKTLMDFGLDESTKEEIFLFAVKYNNTYMVNYLLGSSMGHTKQDENGYTTLHLATKWRNVELVKRLLKQDPNTLIEDVNGDNAVFLAVRFGFTDILDLYFKNGFDVNYKNSVGKTSLFIAVEQGKCDVIKAVLNKGASVNDKYSGNITVLYMAVTKGYLEITKLLLSRGADVNYRMPNGYTALHFAAENGFTDIVKILIANGADIKSITPDGWIPLHLATKANHSSVIQVMLETSKDVVHIANAKGLQSIHIAASNGKPKILGYLLDNGANINAKDTSGETPLYKAAKLGHEKAVGLLINRGANIEYCTRWGQRPLHIATIYGHINVIEVLAENGAAINSRDVSEKTPLFEAVTYNKIDAVTTLIKYGANVNLHGELDGIPVTPLSLAKLMGYTNLITILTSYGAKELILGYDGPIIKEIKFISGKRAFVFNWDHDCLNKWITKRHRIVTLTC